MRQTIGRLLPPGEQPTPTRQEVEALTGLLRGHVELMIPEVEAAAMRQPQDDVPRYCALACAGTARQRLRSQPSPSPGGDTAHARRLARALTALVDHYQALTGVAMCLVCDRPIEDDDKAVPYDHASLSGGTATAGRVHVQCESGRAGR
ncbi:DUF6415 family natural product biosynthesis protein [Streptomyces sp. NPDC007148]|uniref:DUF6415 family natural product biosynthesis protein n=1 Tax=Streptomyces sp. NPDC007148 TaxID=3364775 RepID=UPI00369979C0